MLRNGGRLVLLNLRCNRCFQYGRIPKICIWMRIESCSTVFFKFFGNANKVLLSMRSNLSSRACSNMIFYLFPILTIEFDSLYKLYMFFLGPPTRSFTEISYLRHLFCWQLLDGMKLHRIVRLRESICLIRQFYWDGFFNPTSR